MRYSFGDCSVTRGSENMLNAQAVKKMPNSLFAAYQASRWV